MPKKYTNLKNKLLMFTGHGVADLVNSKSLTGRLMWLIFILISIGVTFYLIISSVIAFKNFEIVTNIKLVYQTELEFPAITICPLNIKNPRNFFMTNLNFNELDLYIPNYIDDVQIEQMCLRFNGKNLNSPKKLLNSKNNSYLGGLNMGFYIHPEEISIDLYLFIHPGTVIPLEYEIQGAPKSNIITNIILEKTVQISLGNPYSDCVSINDLTSYDSDLVRETLKSGYLYRQKDCLDVCIKKNFTHCTECEKKPFIQSKCSKLCPLECESTTYKQTVFEEKLSSNSVIYKDMINNYTNLTIEYFNFTKLTPEEFLKDFSLIYIYFDELKYTKISQIEKYTDIDLMSSIGGSLGLFLGMSFMSFFQLIDIIYYTFLFVRG